MNNMVNLPDNIQYDPVQGSSQPVALPDNIQYDPVGPSPTQLQTNVPSVPVAQPTAQSAPQMSVLGSLGYGFGRGASANIAPAFYPPQLKAEDLAAQQQYPNAYTGAEMFGSLVPQLGLEGLGLSPGAAMIYSGAMNGAGLAVQNPNSTIGEDLGGAAIGGMGTAILGAAANKGMEGLQWLGNKAMDYYNAGVPTAIDYIKAAANHVENNVNGWWNATKSNLGVSPGLEPAFKAAIYGAPETQQMQKQLLQDAYGANDPLEAQANLIKRWQANPDTDPILQAANQNINNPPEPFVKAQNTLGWLALNAWPKAGALAATIGNYGKQGVRLITGANLKSESANAANDALSIIEQHAALANANSPTKSILYNLDSTGNYGAARNVNPNQFYVTPGNAANGLKLLSPAVQLDDGTMQFINPNASEYTSFPRTTFDNPNPHIAQQAQPNRLQKATNITNKVMNNPIVATTLGGLGSLGRATTSQGMGMLGSAITAPQQQLQVGTPNNATLLP